MKSVVARVAIRAARPKGLEEPDGPLSKLLARSRLDAVFTSVLGPPAPPMDLLHAPDMAAKSDSLAVQG